MMRVDGSGSTNSPIAPPRGVAAWVKKLHVPAMWAAARDGAGVTVAVIDTGADLSHPFLAPAIVASASFVPGESVTDGHGHGTHVAGIIRQVAPEAKLIIAKGISNADRGEDAWLAAAIRWCMKQGAQVINASWGDSQEPPMDGELHAAIREAVAGGVLFVAAAGNAGHEKLELNTVGWPARWPEPLAVAATWQIAGGRDWSSSAPYSSAGPEIDVAAPGTWIQSCAPGGGWVDMSGTSMAAPVVSGLATLLIDDWRTKTGSVPTEPELVTMLKFLTRDILPAGRDPLAGVGEVDLAPMVQRRRVILTDGADKIDVDLVDTLDETAVPLDVAARIEQGRFLAPFRGTLTAAGAHTIAWDGVRRQGVAEIDVLPMGTPPES